MDALFLDNRQSRYWTKVQYPGKFGSAQLRYDSTLPEAQSFTGFGVAFPHAMPGLARSWVYPDRLSKAPWARAHLSGMY